ncbi:universal stress protein [Brevibacterium litoralis]|uniref:universal stress protein n=1 Tax=Brevibacterium litoralis TaxID=3138935 RepID=UPI0032EB1614
MTIILGYTPSPEGLAALDFALAEAKAHGDRLLAINAGIGEARPTEEKGLCDDDQLHRLRAVLEDSGVDHAVEQHLRGKDAAEELLDAVQTTPDTRMLVIGSRRRSAVGKLIMGSIAQRLILGSDVPVVSVKAPH